MRFNMQPWIVAALGIAAAAQDIIGTPGGGLDSNGIEAREPKFKAGKKTKAAKTTKAAVTKSSAHVATTSKTKVKTTSTSSSVKSSLTNAKTSSFTSTAETTSSSTSSSASIPTSLSTASSSSISSTFTSDASGGILTGTATQTELTTTASTTSDTSTASSIATYLPTRAWCANDGSCNSNACTAPLVTSSASSDATVAERSYPISLSKRTFVDPTTDWEKLADLDESVEVSTYDDSDFIKFGTGTAAAYIDGLIGCTAVGIFSKKGMQVYHLWESPAYQKTGTSAGNLQRDPVGTLWPAKNMEYLKKTLENAKKAIEANKAKFAGGQVTLMLPKQGSDYLYEVDETYEWTDKTKSGAVSKAEWGRMAVEKPLVKQGKGTVDLIKTMVKEATGISTIQESIMFRTSTTIPRAAS